VTKRVVVLGGSGFVGSRVRELWADALAVVAPSHADLDVCDAGAVRAYLAGSGARAVLNLAAWAGVDTAEEQRGDTSGQVYALNALFPERLAETCRALGQHLVHVSTDYVFDGTNAERPYRESDPTGPALCWYAETKLRGEQAVLAADAGANVARIEMPFSGREQPRRDFARTILGRLRAGQSISGVVDQHITPVFLDDAVHALRLLIDAPSAGVVHVAAADWTTPFRFAQSIARRVDLDSGLIEPEDFAIFAAKRPAQRPQHSWLDVSLFASRFGVNVLRSVEEELDSWCDQLEALPV
jgi:dTDP-4-dehydrorhamnose reductase